MINSDAKTKARARPLAGNGEPGVRDDGEAGRTGAGRQADSEAAQGNRPESRARAVGCIYLLETYGNSKRFKIRVFREEPLTSAPSAAGQPAGAALVQMRWDRSTPEERSAAARHAALARWGSKKEKHKTQ